MKNSQDEDEEDHSLVKELRKYKRNSLYTRLYHMYFDVCKMLWSISEATIVEYPCPLSTFLLCLSKCHTISRALSLMTLQLSFPVIWISPSIFFYKTPKVGHHSTSNRALGCSHADTLHFLLRVFQPENFYKLGTSSRKCCTGIQVHMELVYQACLLFTRPKLCLAKAAGVLFFE